MLSFINPLTSEDFDQKTEFLIEGFLPKHLITLIYADGGMGKSFLSMAISKYAAVAGMDVYYLDFDNPMNVLKERGIESKLIAPYQNLHYSHRSKSELSPLEMLEQIEQAARGKAFQNALFVIDSLRDIADVNNDAAAMKLGDKLKNIREAGATILALHHSNKDGRNYQGSNNLRNSVDNMYQLTKIDAPEGQIRWVLTVKKERASIVDTAFAIHVQDFSLMAIDIETARLSSDDKSFIDQVKTALTQNGSMNKTALLEAVGCKKDDKTARDRLDQYDGLYWSAEKQKGVYTYSLI